MFPERTVGYNARTFLIDGQPEIVLCAAAPYSRVPRHLWADHIARMKRGGMNAIATGVDWNACEAKPGDFDSADDRDLDAFLSECERQGMYVIVRLGSFTGAEPFLPTPDRWLDALAPLIARHQWTRGGGVILVQVEDGCADTDTDDEQWRVFQDGLVRRGITVPVVSRRGPAEGADGLDDPAERVAAAQRGGTVDGPLLATGFGGVGEDLEYASLRCWAGGAGGCIYDDLLSEDGRLTDRWHAARRVAWWARTFREILTTGERRSGIRATDGLRASETRTPQRGGILFVDNPDPERTVTGSVAPYLPEVTLGPRTLLPWVHDVPLGPADRYLSAYAGLVKSDARVLHAHVLPDPHEGSRVYVYGAPGERAEVVLWSGGERGQAAHVTFATTPQVAFAGPSQVVALSTQHAGRVWIAETDENAPVLIGPDDVRAHESGHFVGEFTPDGTHIVHVLYPDGTLSQLSVDANDDSLVRAGLSPLPPSLPSGFAEGRGS